MKRRRRNQKKLGFLLLHLCQKRLRLSRSRREAYSILQLLARMAKANQQVSGTEAACSEITPNHLEQGFLAKLQLQDLSLVEVRLVVVFSATASQQAVFLVGHQKMESKRPLYLAVPPENHFSVIIQNHYLVELKQIFSAKKIHFKKAQMKKRLKRMEIRAVTTIKMTKSLQQLP